MLKYLKFHSFHWDHLKNLLVCCFQYLLGFPTGLISVLEPNFSLIGQGAASLTTLSEMKI